MDMNEFPDADQFLLASEFRQSHGPTAETFMFWDTETGGIDTKRDQISQFAGVRFNSDLDPIPGEEHMFYCQPFSDRIPHPGAIATTGITLQYLEKHGMPEDEFLNRIQEIQTRPGTTNVGFNSDYDKKITRFSFWRALLNPYPNTAHFDLMNVMRAVGAFDMPGWSWTFDKHGKKSFKLSTLAADNKMIHEKAHDALSDVYATAGLGRKLRDQHPDFWEYSLQMRDKDFAARRLVEEEMLIYFHMNNGSTIGHGKPISLVCMNPHKHSEFITFDLREDPKIIADTPLDIMRMRIFTDSETLRKNKELDKEHRKKFPFARINTNACPALYGQSRPEFMSAPVCKEQFEVLRRHREELQEILIRPGIMDKLKEAFTPDEMQFAPDLDIYGKASHGGSGFASGNDVHQMEQFHRMIREGAGPEQLLDQITFEDARYATIANIFLHRRFGDAMPEATKAAWYEHLENRLIKGEDGFLTFDQFRIELKEVIEKKNPTPEIRAALAKTMEHVHDMEDKLKASLSKKPKMSL